jgi:hypothetical protein
MKSYYEQLLVIAKGTLETLENKLHTISLELKNNTIDTEKISDLNNLTLDMTIPLNEIENYEDLLKFL